MKEKKVPKVVKAEKQPKAKDRSGDPKIEDEKPAGGRNHPAGFYFCSMAQFIQQKLGIGWIQFDIAWHNPEENQSKIEKLLPLFPGDLDMLFLPEMFTTGFSMDPAACAQSMTGRTVQWMYALASELEILVGGSAVIRAGDGFVNRFLLAFPDGRLEYYDKRHLFNHAGEGDHYKPGDSRKVVSYKGWRIMPQICYDLRFPVWSRNNLGYDMLVYVANWPKTRVHHWDRLLLARAIENQSYALGVNRIGKDANRLEYTGHSGLASFDGQWITHAGAEESVFWAYLDHDRLSDYRDTFAFLRDQDTFLIQ